MQVVIVVLSYSKFTGFSFVTSLVLALQVINLSLHKKLLFSFFPFFYDTIEEDNESQLCKCMHLRKSNPCYWSCSFGYQLTIEEDNESQLCKCIHLRKSNPCYYILELQFWVPTEENI